MAKSFILGFLRGLKLPVRLLAGWLKKRRKRNEREEKQRKYVRNFSPTHYSWQKSIGKKKKGKKRRKGLKVNFTHTPSSHTP